MATATQLRKVGNAIAGIAVKVSDTFVESAHDIAHAAREAWGGSLDLDAAEVTTVVTQVTEQSTWKGTSSEKARQSEVRSIISAYTGIEKAAREFRKDYGELRREHFIKLAREIPKCETPVDAALIVSDYYQKRDSNKKGGATKKASIGMGLGIIKNAQTRKRNEIAFRKELAVLCAKHNISY
jgi:hypothetical protein